MKYYLMILVVMLSGCRTFDMIFNPNSYKKIDYPATENKISGNVLVYVDEDNIIKEAVAGEKPIKASGTLKNIGDKAIFNRGDLISLGTDQIDFDKSTLRLKANDENNSFDIEVVDKYKDNIQLSSKCETLSIYDSSELPKIQVKNLQGEHQIIITPIFSNKSECKLLGYQVRYGDQKLSRCRQEAKYVYDTFLSCNGKNPPQRRKKSLQEILFGK